MTADPSKYPSLVAPSEVYLGKAIRELRLERRMTMLDLTDAAGLHYGTISSIEREKRTPRLETLRSLAVGLKVPVVDVMRRADTLRDCDGPRHLKGVMRPKTVPSHPTESTSV